MPSPRDKPRDFRGARTLSRALILAVGFACAGCGAYAGFAKNVLENPSGARRSAALDRENWNRYWRYRLRLAEDFMVPGEGPGLHLPADTIIVRGQRVNVIRWSDSPLQLGWYIGVLALETAAVNSKTGLANADRRRLEERIPADGFNGEAVHLRELYFALSALDRLDRSAESIFARVCSGPAVDAPGFFIRDDVSDSPAMRARMGRLWIESDFASLERGDCRADETTLDCLAQCPECFNGEASQDQVYHLLMGLALVKRFVPPGTLVRGVDLNERAREQARRLILYLAANDWEMINPVCGRPVRRGSYARGYSYATACAADKLTDGEYRPAGSSCLWTGAGLSGNPVYMNPDNRHLAMVVAAVGEAWGEDTFIDLSDLAAAEDWHIYPLLYLALHEAKSVGPDDRRTLRQRVYPILDSAPADGPAFDGAPQPNPGWSSANRFLRGKERQQGSGINYGAMYNGLDYLLLYGLSRVVFE